MKRLLKRIKTLWYLSGLTKEDLQENPQLFNQMIQKADSPNMAYIIGLSDDEQSFKDNLNVDNRDSKLL